MLTRQKAILIAALLVASFSGAFCAYVPPAQRTVLLQNRSWKFIKQDASGAQDPSFNDASWSAVGLPHSFDIPYWRRPAATTPTVGWYRKHVSIDPSWITTKRIFIEFEAAFLISQVYVNGTLAGTHQGGYTGFSYDITTLLHAGDNVLAVRVDGTWCDTVAPRSGEHIFIGGIYRDVYLVITDPLHVTWYGTFVSTPQATASSATVKVKTEIKNDGAAAATCKVKSIVTDASGDIVTSFESAAGVSPGALDTFVQTSGAIGGPHLWSPSSPYLYKVYTEVYNGTALVDNFESPLGIRTVRWDKDSGFFLNGGHLWLQGANAHQDHAGWGDAAANSGSFRDVKLIKDCGMNFIRGSHYPHDPAFSGACDTYGICLWSEATFWGLFYDATGWKSGAYPANATESGKASFEANCISQLKEMIRIHRNHPSVIIWSMGNEAFFTNDLTRTQNLARQMVAAAHAEDSTRAAGIGGAQRNGFDAFSDVAGYNGDGAVLYLNPAWPSMVSEYGSCTEDRPGNYTACWGDMVTQTQNDSPIQYAWRSGVALWCAFHHGSNNNAGTMGMIDHARLPLQRWYYYRNKYLGIAPPVWPAAGTAAKLKLTTDNDTITDDGRDDCQLIVQVQDASGNWISNQPSITLTDRNGLGLFPGGTSVAFVGGAVDKGVLNGLAAIEYRSYAPGTAIVDASSSDLTGASVTIFVKHASDTITTSVSSLAQIGAKPSMGSHVFKNIGNRIALPNSLGGKKFIASVFDLQGRLLFSKTMTNKNVIDLAEKDKAGKVFLVKIRVLSVK
jgi:beta-galactosidase